MKTACVAFIDGCPRNMMDASRLSEYLKRNGWTLTNRFQEADLIFMGTCAFSAPSEEKSFGFISITAAKKKKDAQIVVFGCLPGISEERLREHNVVPISMRSARKLDQLINATVPLEDVNDPNLMAPEVEKSTAIYSPFDRLRIKLILAKHFVGKALLRLLITNPAPLHYCYEKIYNIKIGRGCLMDCTYCAIKLAAGQFRSKPLDLILSEFRTGLNEGYTVFRLVAEDVGAYGQDVGLSIADLLGRMLQEPGDYRLTWDDFNPYWLIKYFPALFKIFGNNINRFGYMGFPMQSGSEHVLKLMNRGYTAADAKRCFIALREAFPELKLTTHFLLGFPGETTADFEDTANFAQEVRFNHITAYKYDDRPKTNAIRFPAKVSAMVKYARLWLLQRQFKESCLIG